MIKDWQAFLNQPEEPVVEHTSEPQPEPAAPVTPAVDLVAQAEADAIRTRSYAEAEEQRIKAEAEAEAIKIKAEVEAEKQRLSNERAAMRMERDRAEHEAHLEDIQRKREKAARTAEEERIAAEQSEQAEAEGAAKVDESANRWRKAALAFAIMCAVVALPVQMSAFYNPAAKWLLAAPVMLEAGAWVILAGAAAAVAAHRPHWHYRLIAWALAFVAAAVNLVHGLEHFDPATAIGTAFASLAGPGVWDLHEHGRIRKRDGALTRRERKAAKKAAKKAAAEKAAAKLFEAERQAHIENAERAAAQKLDADRAAKFPKVHEHALKLAADLGETTITQTIWKRAKRDVEGTDPGESAEIVRMRKAAEAEVEAARLDKPVSTPGKSVNAQHASQMPPIQKTRIYNPPARPGRRRPGDTPKYVAAARKQAAITARSTVRPDTEETR
ncbi:hypothetical protein ABZ401_19200 [Streptomyces sp. NPDC005892]|uniref:hypothetical protein n=1 Tax=Streptomyces sp. NPDC005892 TaxID=3155593 RepID=UPI0033C27795